ncbi:MAG TPA: ABC transporter permease, partial [Candidatus Acidoferrum sp.]|nr:ABC transporter permease [Candidatus Acidoferrum sp.]
MGISPMDGLTSVPPLAGRVVVSTSRFARVKKAWITFYETFKLSLDALRAHKLRSFLTLLGVILAVTTLVFVMSVIAGLNLYVAERVANLGANVFIVDRFGIITSRDEFIKAQKRPLVTLDEYRRLRDSMRLARAVAAEGDLNNQTRVGDIIMENTDIMGATPNFADVRNLNIAEGRFITPADDEHHSDVAFIGADLATKFFPNVDPLGKSIRVGTHSYEVIGVAEAIGSA